MFDQFAVVNQLNRKCAFFVLACFTSATLLIHAQQNAPVNDSKLIYERDPANLPTALANLRSGDFASQDLNLIARFHATQAIPDLEVLFATKTDGFSNDPTLNAFTIVMAKDMIASTLMQLGDKNDLYWNYLEERARKSIESDRPNPYQRDSKGKILPTPSPAYVEWLKRKNITKEQDTFIKIDEMGAIMRLAETGDKRIIPLLRQALDSYEILIVDFAAMGLAKVHDNGSIPLIIDACNHHTAEERSALAWTLVYFDDPTAQNEVDILVPKETAKILRAHRAEGYGPLD